MFDPDRDEPLAMCLSALAGFVDAVGFLWLGGVFVSFMSGNSTQLATELGGDNWSRAAIPAAVVATFIAGVVLATILRRTVRRGRPATMLLVTSLLLASALLQSTGHATLAIGAATLAMGAENSMFEHDGVVSVGVTYMTGTLVKMGQHLALALLGGPPFGWLPNLLRWLGLLGGAVVGSMVYRRIGLDALWVAAAVAATLTVVTLLQPED